MVLDLGARAPGLYVLDTLRTLPALVSLSHSPLAVCVSSALAIHRDLLVPSCLYDHATAVPHYSASAPAVITSVLGVAVAPAPAFHACPLPLSGWALQPLSATVKAAGHPFLDLIILLC